MINYIEKFLLVIFIEIVRFVDRLFDLGNRNCLFHIPIFLFYGGSPYG